MSAIMSLGADTRAATHEVPKCRKACTHPERPDPAHALPKCKKPCTVDEKPNPSARSPAPTAKHPTHELPKCKKPCTDHEKPDPVAIQAMSLGADTRDATTPHW